MDYYVYLIIFYTIFGLWEFNFKSERRNWLYVLIMVLPMFILVAFRSENIGNDTLSYAFFYDRRSDFYDLEEVLLSSGQEIGYLATTWFCSTILKWSYFQFQIASCAFVYFSIAIFLRRYSCNVALCCLLFATDGFMGGSMNVARMYLAMSILLYSIPFIQNKKLIIFLGIVLLATLFHTSAFLFVVMYPLCVMPYDRKRVGMIILVAVVIMFLGSTFFRFLTDSIGVYGSYVNEGRFENANKLAVVVNLVIVFLIMLFARAQGFFNGSQYVQKSDFSGNAKEMISITYIVRIAFILSFALALMGLSNNIMSRISRYFSVMNLLLISYSLQYVRENSMRTIFYWGIALAYIAYFFAVLILRPDWNHLVPYEWGF